MHITDKIEYFYYIIYITLFVVDKNTNKKRFEKRVTLTLKIFNIFLYY